MTIDRDLPAAVPPRRPAGDISDRLYGWRDRLLTSPSFHRWASRFPVSRGLARRRSRELFDLCAGFVYSQVLAACVQLRVLELLRDEGPLTGAELASRLRLSDHGARALLAAASALRLLERRRGDRFGLGVLGGAALGNPGVLAMIAHQAMLYGDLSDPVAALRAGRGAGALAAYWPYASGAGVEAETAEPYSQLMAASQPLVAEQVLDAYPVARHRALLDIGGGDGTFLAAAGRRAPGLRLVLFDLPPVASLAEARFAREGLSTRARVVSGSFLDDPLPTDCDLASLVRVLHDHDDGPALSLLRAARAALPAGGALLIAEPTSDAPAGRSVEAYFSVYLHAMGSGRPRSLAEIAALLREADFGTVTTVRTSNPLLARLIIAKTA